MIVRFIRELTASAAAAVLAVALLVTPAPAQASPSGTGANPSSTQAPAADASKMGIEEVAPSSSESDPSVLLCCSHIYNLSQYGIRIYKDWTCNWGTTASSSTGCYGGESRWLSPGQDSGFFQDWDVLQVDAGWCYKVAFNLPYKEWIVTYNRSGLSNLYVKVEDHANAYVLAQGYGYCPA